MTYQPVKPSKYAPNDDIVVTVYVTVQVRYRSGDVAEIEHLDSSVQEVAVEHVRTTLERCQLDVAAIGTKKDQR